MIFRLLLFAILVVLWWGALWFALPGWLQGSMPSLVGVHVGPPLLLVTVWWTGKRAWAWRVERVKKRAKETEVAEKKATQEAAKAAHLQAQEQLRVPVECRAITAAVLKVPEVPDWFEEGAAGCALAELTPEVLQGRGYEDALISSLDQVFEITFSQCPASVWLPIALVSDDPAQQRLIGEVWRQAVELLKIEHHPPEPDFMPLSGGGEIADRLIALFENAPDLPAVVLIGMDSPFTKMPQMEEFNLSKTKLGHAVIVMLVSRSGLDAPGSVESASIEHDKNPMTPYWERERRRDTDSPPWQRIPPLLRSSLWELVPFATLHRSGTAHDLEKKRNSILTRQIHETILDACVRAGFHDLPFEPAGAGEDAQAKPDGPEKNMQAKPEESKPLEQLGWFVHNCESARFGALCTALGECGCEIDPFAEASNLEEAHGDVGVAHDVLMLAGALIRVAQLQQPVLAVGFKPDNSIGIVLARPISEDS